MLQEISYHLIFGKPLLFYLGVLTLAALLITAAVPLLNRHGIRLVPFAWHPRLAGGTIALALLHGALGVLAYL